MIVISKSLPVHPGQRRRVDEHFFTQSRVLLRRCHPRCSTFGKIQYDAVGIGERILTNSAALHIFFCYMPKNTAANVFRRSLWKRGGECRKVFLSIFQALNREAKVIETLPHAHVRVVSCPSYEEIHRAVGYTERIFIANISAFLQAKDLMI